MRSWAVVLRRAGKALFRDAEDDHPQRHVDLRRGQAGAADIGQGFRHIGDQPANLGGGRIGHRIGPPAQHRMSHAGDLENGHGLNMSGGGESVKRPALYKNPKIVLSRPPSLPFRAGENRPCRFSSATTTSIRRYAS